MTLPHIRAKILINATARTGVDDAILNRLRGIFADHGSTAEVVFAASTEELSSLAKAATEDVYDLVVAGGGDGTANLVASALVDTDKCFGVLPLGTFNHFAKDLHLPLDFEEAVLNLLTGARVRVDVGEVNGHIFLNNSSLGLYPTLVREREKRQRLGKGKWPAFVWAALTALRRYPFIDVRLSVDDKILARRTPFVFVGNNEYVMERLDIGRRERLDAGVLSVYITNRTGRIGLARLAIRALFGRLRNDKDFLALKTREITISPRSNRARVAFDGEVDILKAPLEYRIRPRALTVIVPSRTNE
jgi:diacylglycerol kinase family enzyme